MPLPLKEFYPITQAAELLECSVEDLVHWAMTGCIMLYIKIERAEGVLIDTEIEGILPANFDKIVTGTKYEKKLTELERLEEEGEEDCQNAMTTLIYNAMDDYVFKHGGVESLDAIGARESFSRLTYFYRHEVTEDYCLIRSCEWTKALDFGNVSEAFLNMPHADAKSFVYMEGFFGLSACFFEGFTLRNSFLRNDFGDDVDDQNVNFLYMPENRLCINLIATDNVCFDINDLFIFKSDFYNLLTTIRKSGSEIIELEKKYFRYRISNNHGWWKVFNTGVSDCINKDEAKNERISTPLRDAFKLLIAKHYSDLMDNPSKLAVVLSAEAEGMGINNLSFDKTTVSRWMSKGTGKG